MVNFSPALFSLLVSLLYVHVWPTLNCIHTGHRIATSGLKKGRWELLIKRNNLKIYLWHHLQISSSQNCFSSAIFLGCLLWIAFLGSSQSVSIRMRSRLWLQKVYLVQLKPFVVDLFLCFGSLSCLHHTSSVELELVDRWPSGLLQNVLINVGIHLSVDDSTLFRPWGGRAAPNHDAPSTYATTLHPPCSTVGTRLWC